MNGIYLALLFLSAATLAFQVTLTRFFALAQGSHLAFMAVSLALLGIGASGSYLSLRPLPAARLSNRLSLGVMLFALSIPGAYLAINYLPFDAYRLAWEPLQLLWLALYYLALTVPFFFGGLVIGAALAAEPAQAGPIYAANLLGSGLGTPLALLALAAVGGSGTIFLCALLGWLAAIIIFLSPPGRRQSAAVANAPDQPARPGRRSALSGKKALSLTLYSIVALSLLYLTIWPPALFDVRLTPYKALSQALLYPGSQIRFQEWNAFSRVDVIESEGIRSAPGLSFTYPGELPPQLGLTVDGDNLSPLSRPSPADFTQYLPPALAFRLRPDADLLVLEPGGGLAVLAALRNGAGSVTVVQSNPTVTKAVVKTFAGFTGNLYADPRVKIIVDEPRSYLRRTDRRFDLILLPLTDSFRPVTAGAYSLNEDYRYTVEALADMLAHLKPEGLLVAERWLQVPPSESLRLWGTVVAALRRLEPQPIDGETAQVAPAQPEQAGAEVGPTSQIAAHLLALRSLQTSLIVAGRSPLSVQDIAAARTFAAEQQADLIWLPDIRADEPNRYSVLAEPLYYSTFAGLLTTSDPEGFYEAYPYAVAPPTDDHPYFFHFFKWGQTPQIIQTLGTSWQPFGGSGYLVLVMLLLLVLIFSAVLILLPLFWLRRQAANPQPEPAAPVADTPFPPPPSPTLTPPTTSAARPSPLVFLLYFALLGLGFLFVEIPLLQRFILYLGQPAYAFAVVVAGLLVASGIGSGYLAGRWRLRLVLPMIALLALVYPLLLPYLFNLTLPLPFAGRVLVTVAALFPLGLLLGIPFPRGLILVGQSRPELVPWIWAVNGCASVVSAVLAAMIALTWGFSVVLWSAAGAYALAGVVIWSESR